MTIEDYIELMADPSKNIISLALKDKKLINSLKSQIEKKLGLTDRQHELAKKKVVEYKQQFNVNGYDCLDIDNLRLPYRVIDRSKTIKIVKKEVADLFNTGTKLMLAIRFPYSNKMIKYINLIKSVQNQKEYDSKSKTHFVELTEQNVYTIIHKFINANFEIESNLLNYYHKICHFENNKEKVLPGIYNYKLKNISKNLEDYALKTIGVPNKKNLAIYYDRKDILGLGYFEENELNISCNLLSNLSQKIVKSDNKTFFISKNNYSLNHIITSLHELKRLPLLIVLAKNKENLDLLEVYNSLTNINYKDISVLFRLDNTIQHNVDFNNNVKKLKLNNPVTTSTKIVILNNDKIPKPLLTQSWKAETTLLMESVRYSKQTNIFHNQAELVLHYDYTPTTWISNNLTNL